MIKAKMPASWQCPTVCVNRKLLFPGCKKWGYRYSPACARLNLGGAKASAKALRWPRHASQSAAGPVNARGQSALRDLTMMGKVCTDGVARRHQSVMPTRVLPGDHLPGAVLVYAGDTAMVISTLVMGNMLSSLGIPPQVQRKAMSGEAVTPPVTPAAMGTAATATVIADYYFQLHRLSLLTHASEFTAAAAISPFDYNYAFWNDSGNSDCGAAANRDAPITSGNRAASRNGSAEHTIASSNSVEKCGGPQGGRCEESPLSVSRQNLPEDERGDGPNRVHSSSGYWDGRYGSGTCGGGCGCGWSRYDADSEKGAGEQTEERAADGSENAQPTVGSERHGGFLNTDGGLIGFCDSGRGGYGNDYGARDQNAPGCEWRGVDSFSSSNERNGLFVHGGSDGGRGLDSGGGGDCGSGGLGGSGGGDGGGQGFGTGGGNDGDGPPRATTIWSVCLSLTVAAVAAALLLHRQAKMLLQHSRPGRDLPRYLHVLFFGLLLRCSLHELVHPRQHESLAHRQGQQQGQEHDQRQECTRHAQELRQRQRKEQLKRQPFAFQLNRATVQLQDEDRAAGDNPLLTGAAAAAAAAAVPVAVATAHTTAEALQIRCRRAAGFTNSVVNMHNLGIEGASNDSSAGPWLAFNTSQLQGHPASWCFPAAPSWSHRQLKHSMAPVRKLIQQQDSSCGPPGGPHHGLLHMGDASWSSELLPPPPQQQLIPVAASMELENRQQCWAHTQEVLQHSTVSDLDCNSGNSDTCHRPKKRSRGFGPMKPSPGRAWVPGHEEPSHETTSAAPRQQRRRHWVSLLQSAVKRRGLRSTTPELDGAAFSATAHDRARPRRGSPSRQRYFGAASVASPPFSTAAATTPASVPFSLDAAPTTPSAMAAVATAAATRSPSPDAADESRDRRSAHRRLCDPSAPEVVKGRPTSVSLHDEIANLKAVGMGLEAAQRRAEQWLAAARKVAEVSLPRDVTAP
ncbi:hypothetical protein Vretimale_14466 [Volvox reticuliferus]|uniref:Uncharacterized protein n=1 Tax=Volvox reticuliferus TaxID=1737510 RepID=A0A8J4CQF3_9CHLO|nr:hypothetical protein Vretifemale_13300 [Volvox reticuliferus]GIM10987.1 hypothetical protein Vretimale_14466 [Volvox reticuliferus]